MAAYCGAKTRAGTPCRRPAGGGTDHVGTGRCKLHGGRGGAPPGSNIGNKHARKHGLYETVIRDRLAPEEQAVFDSVPADVDLANELRILRFKLVRLLDDVEREVVIGTPMGAEKVKLKVDEVTKAYAIEKLVDGIRKLVKDMQGVGADDPLLRFAEEIAKARLQRREDSGGDAA